MKFTQQIEKLKSNQKFLQSQIEIDVKDKCSYIIEVGALTVSTNEHGKVIIENSIQPMQFSENATSEILTLSFKNGKNETIKPIVYGKNNWYKNRLKMVDEGIKSLEKI